MQTDHYKVFFHTGQRGSHSEKKLGTGDLSGLCSVNGNKEIAEQFARTAISSHKGHQLRVQGGLPPNSPYPSGTIFHIWPQYCLKERGIVPLDLLSILLLTYPRMSTASVVDFS